MNGESSLAPFPSMPPLTCLIHNSELPPVSMVIHLLGSAQTGQDKLIINSVASCSLRLV